MSDRPSQSGDMEEADRQGETRGKRTRERTGAEGHSKECTCHVSRSG